MSELDTFEGRDVIASTVKITKAGDGLSEALQIEPSALQLGDRCYVVLECELVAVAFAPVKGAEGKLTRVHTLRTEVATLADEQLVEAAITAQRDANEQARLARQRKAEEAAGVQRLRGTEPWPTDDDELPSGPSGIEAHG